jgi:hypothetical protein
LNIEICCVREHKDNDIREKHTILIALGPHLTPVEEMRVRVLDYGNVKPLVAYDCIDAKPIDEQEITEDRQPES